MTRWIKTSFALAAAVLAAAPAAGQSVPSLPPQRSWLEEQVVVANPTALPKGFVIPQATLPPEEYDKPYLGKLHVVKLDNYAIIHLVCNKNTALKTFVIACTVHTPKTCLIMLGPVAWDNERVLRHELGHCNGWPADHPGRRR